MSGTDQESEQQFSLDESHTSARLRNGWWLVPSCLIGLITWVYLLYWLL